MLNSIEPILLFQRDPMYSISELHINPSIMFKYKEHVRFQYFTNNINTVKRYNSDVRKTLILQ